MKKLLIFALLALTACGGESFMSFQYPEIPVEGPSKLTEEGETRTYVRVNFSSSTYCFQAFGEEATCTNAQNMPAEAQQKLNRFTEIVSNGTNNLNEIIIQGPQELTEVGQSRTKASLRPYYTNKPILSNVWIERLVDDSGTIISTQIHNDHVNSSDKLSRSQKRDIFKILQGRINAALSELQ
mgnify:CR=1 FL=1